MPPAQYITTISKPSTWGGAIELSVLAKHYRVEIASIDVETGRIDRFTPPAASHTPGMRALLIYSGIHYDAATLAPMPDAPPEWHQTQFPIVRRFSFCFSFVLLCILLVEDLVWDLHHLDSINQSYLPLYPDAGY